MNNRTLSAIVWIVVLQLISWGMGNITKDNLTWYHLINKSALTPGNHVFMIAWFFLYSILGIIGSFLWRHRDHQHIKVLWNLFLFILILTFTWTPLFFHYKSILGGLIILLAIIILTAIFITKAYKNDFSKIALWMIPFLLWSMFAYYLNLVIWLNNC